jgi:hypothetical protein
MNQNTTNSGFIVNASNVKNPIGLQLKFQTNQCGCVNTAEAQRPSELALDYQKRRLNNGIHFDL